MSVEMINGYPCANCAEVSLAKRGIDPHKKPGDPEGLDKDAAKGVAGTGAATGASGTGDGPAGVEAKGDAADVRAPLDYTQNLDKLA
jgi:hypothetical protein